MDRFEAMRAFSRVVETGSFTKAAETLNISRTSVTQLIQQLEARLRVPAQSHHPTGERDP
jgi:DNA-binding transcriptional LysR family regulator